MKVKGILRKKDISHSKLLPWGMTCVIYRNFLFMEVNFIYQDYFIKVFKIINEKELNGNFVDIM
ncbi:hypothetical protein [Clostridium yunnanense]|uniref:hypothetical protein n=1 Tax=Clostridium yunnanense TaxID=2800325 RepID=UPI00190482ED|nr:hypothetical protein [Clostridium yunnanense]